MHRFTTFALSLFVLAFVAACDEDDPIEVETPVLAERMVESFGGTIEQLGTSVHLFSIAGRNDTEISITSLEPLSTLTVGLGVGTSDDGGATCALLAQDRSVRVGETLLVSSLAIGDYCVAVFDVGNIFPDQTVTYAIDVLHP